MYCVKVHLLQELHDREEDGVINLQGTVHLFRYIPQESTTHNPLNDHHETICILGVPSTMENSDLLQFTGPFSDSIKNVQCIRNDVNQVFLLKFDSQESAETFYRFYNGGNLLPLKLAVCHVVLVSNVEYTKSSQQASAAPPGLTEIPTCTVCLERLDENISGVPTTLSDNFTPRETSCIVCRLCTQHDKTSCSACPTSENLWVCMICAFVGCGRYKEGHAIKHWKESKHCYSLELESQRVWDYVGDSYVHRIIQSKGYGDLMELSTSSNNNDDCGCSRSSHSDDHVYINKLQTLEYEYNSLLTLQSESQRKYYEKNIAEIESDKEREASAIEKHASVKLQKLQDKLNKIEEENKFLRQINQCFEENQKGWEKKLQNVEERGNVVLKRKDQRISELEQQIQGLMERLDKPKAGNK